MFSKSIYLVMFLLLPSAWALTGLVRKYATRQGIMDIPNSRSSHSIPKPRGGGLSFVIVFLLFAGIYFYITDAPISMSLGLIGPGMVIAAVGWLDDKKNVFALLRAAIHLLAAIWAVQSLGGVQEIGIGAFTVELGFLGSALAVFGIVWSINMYNFMDGIDGLAASEAVVVSIIGGILALTLGNMPVALLAFGVSLSVAGFLIWNWPPAKIFMGDVGSGFLGFVFAYLALLSEKTSGVPLIVWIMLLSVFVVDATLTLLRRVFSGERWYEAHRTHVYQLAVQARCSHRQVTVAIVTVNLILGVLGAVANIYTQLGFAILIVVYVLLAAAHVHYYRKWSSITVAKSFAGNNRESMPNEHMSS